MTGTTIYCSSCGKIIAGDSTFCKYCGHQVYEGASPSLMTYNEPVTPTNDPAYISNVVFGEYGETVKRFMDPVRTGLYICVTLQDKDGVETTGNGLLRVKCFGIDVRHIISPVHFDSKVVISNGDFKIMSFHNSHGHEWKSWAYEIKYGKPIVPKDERNKLEVWFTPTGKRTALYKYTEQYW